MDGWKIKAKQVRSNEQRENPIVETVDLEKPNEADKSEIQIELTSEEKGRGFEEYIVEKFDKKYFKLYAWRGDKHYKGIYPLSNKNPDLVYEFNYDGYMQKFALECKYLSYLQSDFITLDKRKFEDYKNYELSQRLPVYIIYGIGGTCKNPNKLILFKLSEIHKNVFHINQGKSHFSPNSFSFFYNRNLHRLT